MTDLKINYQLANGAILNVESTVDTEVVIDGHPSIIRTITLSKQKKVYQKVAVKKTLGRPKGAKTVNKKMVNLPTRKELLKEREQWIGRDGAMLQGSAKGGALKTPDYEDIPAYDDPLLRNPEYNVVTEAEADANSVALAALNYEW